jgi:exonuclease III
MNMDIEMNPGPNNTQRGLAMAHLNIQSVYMVSITQNPRVKLDDVISTLVIDREVDVICMSETWLHDQIKNDKIMIPGFQEPIRRDRIDRTGGGVCAYISENITCERLDRYEPQGIDLIWVQLSLQSKKVILGVCYTPPGQNRDEVEQFLEQFQNSLEQISALLPESIIIMGDLNDKCLTWDSVHTNSELKNDLFDIVNLHDMTQLIDKPTHVITTPGGGISENILDLIITDSPGYVKSVELLPPLGSHHATLFMEFEITYHRDKSYTRHVWDYGKGNYNLLNVTINRHP